MVGLNILTAKPLIIETASPLLHVSNNGSSTEQSQSYKDFHYHLLQQLVVVVMSSLPGLLLQLVGPAEYLLGQRKDR